MASHSTQYPTESSRGSRTNLYRPVAVRSIVLPRPLRSADHRTFVREACALSAPRRDYTQARKKTQLARKVWSMLARARSQPNLALRKAKMSWQFTVGLKSKEMRTDVDAEDALIAALKVKAERPGGHHYVCAPAEPDQGVGRQARQGQPVIAKPWHRGLRAGQQIMWLRA